MIQSLGTLMRAFQERTDGAIAQLYADLGLPDYRPRYSPVVRALVETGPMTIRDLATAIGVTHSAASQTVTQMRRAGFLDLHPGPADARQRIVHLTGRCRDALPLIEAEWQATTLAIATLDAELPIPLADLLTSALQALEDHPFRTRLLATAPLAAYRDQRSPADGKGPVM
ncbi:MarR family winged helix-turn-helix transcriptional regulator [Nonomuraea sp. NPDC052265]|uniref:MarR family winged helix-turn-helix transcriptional regulator n=1 Tax=Nonomuraea sp. NPDC052265 TaxID=3364374 RepID=UPI0037C51FFB